MELEDVIPTPVTSILIETVKNGFVVYENYYKEPMRDPGVSVKDTRMVFNTKDQLNEYINKKLV